MSEVGKQVMERSQEMFFRQRISMCKGSKLEASLVFWGRNSKNARKSQERSGGCKKRSARYQREEALVTIWDFILREFRGA